MRNAGFFLHIFGIKINRFFIDFGVIFPPGGTPGAARAAFFPGWGPRSIFYRFQASQGGFGTPLGSFGAPLGPTWALKVSQSVKKSVPGAQCVPEASLGVKREGPGPS